MFCLGVTQSALEDPDQLLPFFFFFLPHKQICVNPNQVFLLFCIFQFGHWIIKLLIDTDQGQILLHLGWVPEKPVNAPTFISYPILSLNTKGRIIFHFMDDQSTACDQIWVTHIKHKRDSVTFSGHLCIPIIGVGFPFGDMQISPYS